MRERRMEPRLCFKKIWICCEDKDGILTTDFGGAKQFKDSFLILLIPR